MNARTSPAQLQAPVRGALLYKSFSITDTLQVDLYGSVDSEDGNLVEGVAVSGTLVDISALISGDQLAAMGEWLDLKDNPDNSFSASRALSKAMRCPL
jgi:hypothetical protein